MKNTLETTRHSSLVQVCAAHDTLFSQMEAIADQIYLSDSFHKFELEKTPEKALGIIEELNILNQTCSYLDEIVFHFAGDPLSLRNLSDPTRLTLNSYSPLSR